MKCRGYKDEDFEAVKSWYSARSAITPPKTALPMVGFIVPGIAAGFLMQTDTEIAILEPFIANPKADRADRDAALREIMSELTKAAEELGFKSVFGFSAHRGMVERAVSIGFTVIEHESITVWKDLT